MMPPPTMTTSALSNPGHSPELEDELQSGEGRDVSIVERRRDFDDVEAHGARPRHDRPEELERLPGGHAAGRWNFGSRRESGVGRVDVERNVNLLSPQEGGERLRRART